MTIPPGGKPPPDATPSGPYETGRYASGPYASGPYASGPYPPGPYAPPAGAIGPGYGDSTAAGPGSPGYPVAGYGAPPTGYGTARPARPGVVTAAAVLSFVWAGFTLLAALVSLAVGSFLTATIGGCDALGEQGGDPAACASAHAAGGFQIAIGIVLVVTVGLLIWGGVVALTGTNAKVGVIAAGLLILAQIVSLIAAGIGVGLTIVGVIAPILIITFLLSVPARTWFRSTGGATF